VDGSGGNTVSNWNDSAKNMTSARAVLEWTHRYGFQTVLAIVLTGMFMYTYLSTMAGMGDALRALAAADARKIALQERQLEQTQALRADVQALQRAVVYGMPPKP